MIPAGDYLFSQQINFRTIPSLRGKMHLYQSYWAPVCSACYHAVCFRSPLSSFSRRPQVHQRASSSSTRRSCSSAWPDGATGPCRARSSFPRLPFFLLFPRFPSSLFSSSLSSLLPSWVGQDRSAAARVFSPLFFSLLSLPPGRLPPRALPPFSSPPSPPSSLPLPSPSFSSPPSPLPSSSLSPPSPPLSSFSPFFAPCSRLDRSVALCRYSTVTDLARLRGWSTSHPRRTAM